MPLNIDIHEEFMLVPHLHGMRISTPVAVGSNRAISIKEILQLPMNVYFQLPGPIILKCNEHVFTTLFASSHGYASPRDLIGVYPEKICKRSCLDELKRDDHHVLHSKQLMIFENDLVLQKDAIHYPSLSFKFPCYWDENQPPIIFGICILYNNTLLSSAASLSEGLSILLKSGLLNMSSVQYDYSALLRIKEIDGIPITSQEARCLCLAARGMSSKKIAKELNISFKTVERHFENLRYKLKVRSRSELIEKIIYEQSKTDLLEY
jgi:two-component system nitrate/nitrite response regulator NarL